jgi:hypothetical protein
MYATHLSWYKGARRWVSREPESCQDFPAPAPCGTLHTHASGRRAPRLAGRLSMQQGSQQACLPASPCASCNLAHHAHPPPMPMCTWGCTRQQYVRGSKQARRWETARPALQVAAGQQHEMVEVSQVRLLCLRPQSPQALVFQYVRGVESAWANRPAPVVTLEVCNRWQ